MVFGKSKGNIDDYEEIEVKAENKNIWKQKSAWIFYLFLGLHF